MCNYIQSVYLKNLEYIVKIGSSFYLLMIWVKFYKIQTLKSASFPINAGTTSRMNLVIKSIPFQ